MFEQIELTFIALIDDFGPLLVLFRDHQYAHHLPKSYLSFPDSEFRKCGSLMAFVMFNVLGPEALMKLASQTTTGNVDHELMEWKTVKEQGKSSRG